MKKNCLTFFALPFLCLFFCLSCIDNDYNTDGLNDTYQFGNNGFIFPVGNLDVYVYADHHDDEDTEINPVSKSITYTYNVDVLSEGFFDYFTYKFAEEEHAIGSIMLECKIFAEFADPDTKPSLTIEGYVVNPFGEDWELIDKSELGEIDVDDLKAGVKLSLEINQDDIVDMKKNNASEIKFIFHFANLQKTQISASDCARLKDVRLKSTGGIIVKP